MSFMEWSPQYELGIPEMDTQHRRWIELLNHFYDHLEGDEMNHKLATLVQEVIDYTKYHFVEEEKLMTSIGYPALSEQKQMHNAIAHRMADYKKRLDDGLFVVSMPLTAELKAWFREHIMVEDKKYAEMYLKLHQPG